MLEFVHMTGPDGGKDVQTRRKVRSQAMRDFRRRQRVENERKRASSPSLKSGRDRSASDGSVLVARSNSSSSKQSLKPRHDSIQSNRGHLRAPLTGSFSLPILESTTTASYEAPTYWESDQVVVTPPINSQDVFIQDTSFIPSAQPSPALSMATSRGHSESSDMFDSQGHFDQMFEFCKSYISWLCPEIDANAAAEVLTSRQKINTCPTFLAALCLASVGHLGAVRQTDPAFDYAMYKARVFRDINERMKAASTAVTDETVGYLACLLSYEMSNCSKESTLHLRGIQSIVTMKGGLSTFSDPLAMMLECLDLSHALMFDADPMITLPDPACELPSNPNATYEGACSILRLLDNECVDFCQQIDHEHAPYRERLQMLPTLIGSIAEVLAEFVDKSETTSVNSARASNFRQALEQAREMSIVPDAAAPDAHYLARIVYLRVLLVYNISVHHLDAAHPTNQATLHGMWDTAWKIKESTWTHLPYLRLWILIGGATIAQDQIQKSFFKAHLIRLIFRMGVSEWRRVKTFIIRYISSKRLGQDSENSSVNIEAPMPRRNWEANVLAEVPKSDLLSLPFDPQIVQLGFRASSAPVTQPDQSDPLPLPLSTSSSEHTMYRQQPAEGTAQNQYDTLSMHDMDGRSWTGEAMNDLQHFYNVDSWTLDN